MKFKNASLEDDEPLNFETYRKKMAKKGTKNPQGGKKKEKGPTSSETKSIPQAVYPAPQRSTKWKPKKLSEIKCYNQQKMSWPKHFLNKLSFHKVDFDEESNEEIIQYEVDKGIQTLVEEITVRKIFEMEDTRGFS